MTLQAWLVENDPEACDWDETVSDEQKCESLATALKRLHQEYTDEVLHGCYRWQPGQTYEYQGNPRYGLQPHGWGIAGIGIIGFHGMGERAEPVMNTAYAWQEHCAQQLAARWAREVAEVAAEIDLADWLEQGDEGEAAAG